MGGVVRSLDLRAEAVLRWLLWPTGSGGEPAP